MARKITRKNFYMEIRRNFGRFISILFIVALGVAFFSGIRASEPSMRITGDAYFDESDLMDIKAVSTLGITKEDVSAVGNVKGVGKAEGAYSADFLNIKNKKQYVLHVMSAMEDMNKITVREGRMPEKAGECLVDDQMNYKIGETIKLKSGTDDKVTDTLKTDELKVVGNARRLSKLVNSSCCIAHMTSEKRSVARRYMQHSTWIFSAVSCWNTCAPRMSSSDGASATSCTSNVICRMTHAAASTQASPSVRR